MFKKIKQSRNDTLLLGIMVGGIILVMIAYKIFAYLCEVPAFQWWMVLLGIVCVAMAIFGFLLAYHCWRRLQYLRDHPFD